jgi:hypothetical protein
MFSINLLTLILAIVGQCDAKHIMTLAIKTITEILRFRHALITDRPIRLAVILTIMFFRSILLTLLYIFALLVTLS